MKQDLLTFANWTPEAMQNLLQLAVEIKQAPASYSNVLAGKSIVALFEKPSLRTRVSFDIGINKLGGHMVYLDVQSGKLAGREDAVDTAANLACWADAIVARVFSHTTLETFSKAANVPVVNALCDKYHPCQGLADYLTMFERFGKTEGLTMAYVGDGNNVTHSLLIVGALLGCNQVVVTPEGHEASPEIVAQAKAIAEKTGVTIVESTELSAANGADVIYADTWLSMGDDTPLDVIKEKFMPYQVNEALMEATGASYVMHCQPAHRDLEITGSLIDSDKSLLMQQAENRMHGQNAILTQLLAKAIAEKTGVTIVESTELSAANGADVIYADTWLSMGDDTPLDVIKEKFMPYQVNEALMEATGASYVMHCQPAHRDLEITGSLIDSDKSLLMQQAENRMHGQNAILTQLLNA